MSDDSLLKEIFDQYEETEFKLIPEPARTLVCVYSAHGIIGNGGFRYFFENNFSKNNDEAIRQIINSYNNIGLIYHALAIKDMISLFPNSKLHSDLKERRKFLSKYFNDESTNYLTEIDQAENIFFSQFEKAFEYALSYFRLHSS